MYVFACVFVSALVWSSCWRKPEYPDVKHLSVLISIRVE